MILNHVKKLSSVLHALCIQYHLMQCWAKQTEGNFCKTQVEIPAEYIIVTMLAMCFDCQEPRVCHSHMPRWSTREEMKSGRFFSSDSRKAMRMAWSDDTLDGAQVTLVSCWHPNNGTRVPSLSDWEWRTRVHKRHWIDLYRAFKSWVYGSSLFHQSHRCHPFWSHSCKIWLLLEIDASFFIFVLPQVSNKKPYTLYGFSVLSVSKQINRWVDEEMNCGSIFTALQIQNSQGRGFHPWQNVEGMVVISVLRTRICQVE